MTPTISADAIFPYFFALWIGLMIAGFLMFWRGNNVVFKRKWLPRYIIFTGVLFVGFIVLLMIVDPKSGPPPITLLFVIPVVALITYVNIKIIKICGKCGKMNYPMFMIPAKFCAKCGAPTDSSIS